MITLNIHGDDIHHGETKIPIDLFELLTGKKIDWSLRNKKAIELERHKGHIYLYDTTFTIGGIYRNIQRKDYICTHVSEDGSALLTSTSGTELETMVQEKAKNWEIIK